MLTRLASGSDMHTSTLTSSQYDTGHKTGSEGDHKDA